MARIVVFGSTGRAGSAAVDEARGRGHEVTALTRTTGDVTDVRGVAAVAADHDVAIVAAADMTRDPTEFFPLAARSVTAGLSEAGVPRLVWVSLASLLPDPDGVVLMDTLGYPPEYRPFSLAHRQALDIVGESGLGWVAVSPSGDFDYDGQPTGAYGIAPGDLAARITYADHARALVDEAERPQARRAHVGVRAR